MTHIQLDEVGAWAVAGGEIALGYFNRVSGRRKADRSWVTEADEAVERFLVERIVERHPGHGIIGEEHTRSKLDNEFVWAIDPIDGTAAFVSGLPIWGVSIGLFRDRKPYLGVIYLPLLKDVYYAGPEGGAFFNDQQISVTTPEQWESETWLAVPSDTHRHFDLDFVGKTRTLGSTAAAMCYVARGSAVAALLTQVAIWDIAAGLAIISAAGGACTTLDGAPLDINPMLDGRAHYEPLLVAHPSQVARLQNAVRRRLP